MHIIFIRSIRLQVYELEEKLIANTINNLNEKILVQHGKHECKDIKYIELTQMLTSIRSLKTRFLMYNMYKGAE